MQKDQVQLSLEKTGGTIEFFHTETKTTYELRPLTAKQYAVLRAKNTKNGTVDTIGLGVDVAVKVIADWGQEAECNPANLTKFGEKYAFKIMPEITDKAMEFAVAVAAEVDAAKND